MVMTIKKAHEILSNGLVNASSEHEWCMAFKMAIEIMCKYQKIQEIVKNTQQLCSYGSAFIDIREVVEDGNDN